MIIYVDENMSPYLARGFDILQRPESTKLRDPIEVKSIKDEFGQGALDEDWIPLAGAQNSCIISRSLRTKKELTHYGKIEIEIGLSQLNQSNKIEL